MQTPTPPPQWAWNQHHQQHRCYCRDEEKVKAAAKDVISLSELKTVLFECLLDEKTKKQNKEAFCCVDISSNYAAVDLCKFFESGIAGLRGYDVRAEVGSLQRCIERCYDKGYNVLKTEYGRMCDAFLQVALDADGEEDNNEEKDEDSSSKGASPKRRRSSSFSSSSSSDDDSPSPTIRGEMSKLARNSNALSAMCFFLSINQKLLADDGNVHGRRPNLFAVIIECLAEKYHKIVNVTT